MEEYNALPNCPECKSEYTYEDGNMLVCPMCAHEWSPEDTSGAEEEKVYRDATVTYFKMEIQFL